MQLHSELLNENKNEPPPGRCTRRRIIFALGSPRSGTTWLATLLDSYQGVIYSHEPLTRLNLPEFRSLMYRLKTGGRWEPEEIDALTQEWCKARPDLRKPPFFPKDFMATPAWLQWLSWLFLHRVRLGKWCFHQLFSPSPRKHFDLLIKEVGWDQYARAIVQALDPELIVIRRHPCAVVASIMRGYNLGLVMPHRREEWFEGRESLCRKFGFSKEDILKLDLSDYLAVDWLIQNIAYLDAVKASRRHHLVIYEELCADPAATMTEIFRFLGWQVEAPTLRFLKRSTMSGRSAFWTLLQGRHPYFSILRNSKRSTESWKAELSAEQQRRILNIVSPSFPEYAAHI